MPKLNELLTFEHESEHVFEHKLLVKKNYSTPKVYTASGDLKKRWYVYFSLPRSSEISCQPQIPWQHTEDLRERESRCSSPVSLSTLSPGLWSIPSRT